MSDPAANFDTLSAPALDELVRSLADRGEDHGHFTYLHGHERIRLDDPSDTSAQGWRDAFRAALDLYQSKTGKVWRY